MGWVYIVSCVSWFIAAIVWWSGLDKPNLGWSVFMAFLLSFTAFVDYLQYQDKHSTPPTEAQQEKDK